MAIFAVMHIFAFPWKPYSIKHSYSDPLSEPGSGFSGGDDTKRYKGGPFGLLALADAFNPWDICKMTARGLRWLFVGVRKRHEDVSYANPSKLDPTYGGPTFAGTGEPATELHAARDARGLKGDGFAEDDRQGLLRHSGQMGRVPTASPYRPYESDEYDADSQIDLGRPRQHAPPGTAISTAGLDSKPSDFMDEDTAYQPGYGPSSSAGAGAGAQGLDGASVHPAFRATTQQWSDADSIRPPTYRTTDPRR